MLKENEAILKSRSDVVEKEEGTIGFSLLLLLFFFSRFLSTLTGGRAGGLARSWS